MPKTKLIVKKRRREGIRSDCPFWSDYTKPGMTNAYIYSGVLF